MRSVNLERIIQSEVGQKEKKISHINACIWNLEEWAYLQGSNGGRKRAGLRHSWEGEGETTGRAALKHGLYRVTMDGQRVFAESPQPRLCDN